MNTRFQTAPWSLCYFWWVRRGLGYVLNSRGNQRPPQAGFFADLGDVLHKNHVAGFHSGTYFRRKTHPKILKNSGKIPPKIGILHFKFSRHFTLTFRNLGQPRRKGTWNENQHSDALNCIWISSMLWPLVALSVCTSVFKVWEIAKNILYINCIQ